MVLLGYVAVAAVLVTSASGLVVTWQVLFALRMSPVWHNVHLVSTLVALATAVPTWLWSINAGYPFQALFWLIDLPMSQIT